MSTAPPPRRLGPPPTAADGAGDHGDAAADAADGPRAEARAGTSDGLLDAFGERLLALFDEGASTVRLALAETRLAASAAALLLGLVLVGAALAIVVWLLLVALVGVALAALGLGPATTLALLLLLHLLALAALAFAARALARELAFARTRRALAARQQRAPEQRPATPTTPDATVTGGRETPRHRVGTLGSPPPRTPPPGRR